MILSTFSLGSWLSQRDAFGIDSCVLHKILILYYFFPNIVIYIQKAFSYLSISKPETIIVNLSPERLKHTF